MNEKTSEPIRENNAALPPMTAPNPWPRVIIILGVLAMLLGAGLFVFRQVVKAPAALVSDLRSVASAFSQGTVRTEFLSRATEIAGTSRFQFATLKQAESFKREETGKTAWGWIPLPKVVVQAQAPVEYSYHLDFDAPWEFQRDSDTIIVIPPPITAGTPAIDVSALSFYTLEGSLWRDDKAVRERLRESLTESLKQRAEDNVRLVREVGRQRLADFVTKWLGERFQDGPSFHVKVVFPDERLTPAESKTL